MIKYWWVILAGAIFGLSGCQQENSFAGSYQIQGISAHKGQTVSSLYDANGAPNVVRNLDNGSVVWIYYTNYQTVGGSELISYNQPTNANGGTNCSVQVILTNDLVEQVISNCQ